MGASLACGAATALWGEGARTGVQEDAQTNLGLKEQDEVSVAIAAEVLAEEPWGRVVEHPLAPVRCFCGTGSAAFAPGAALSASRTPDWAVARAMCWVGPRLRGPNVSIVVASSTVSHSFTFRTSRGSRSLGVLN